MAGPQVMPPGMALGGGMGGPTEQDRKDMKQAMDEQRRGMAVQLAIQSYQVRPEIPFDSAELIERSRQIAAFIGRGAGAS